MVTRTKRRASSDTKTSDTDSSSVTSTISISATVRDKKSSTPSTNSSKNQKKRTSSDTGTTSASNTDRNMTRRRSAVMSLRSAASPSPPKLARDENITTPSDKNNKSNDSPAAENNNRTDRINKNPIPNTSKPTNPVPPSSPANSSAKTTKSANETTSDSSLPSRRPKRKAASSVRFGSYRDIDNVDFSLLVGSFSASETSARGAASKLKPSSTAKQKASSKVSSKMSSKTTSPSSSKASSKTTSSKTSKKGTSAARIKRARLMTSSTGAATKKSNEQEGTNTAPPKEHRRPVSSSALKNVPTNPHRQARLGLKTILPPVLIERHDGKITPDMLRSLSSVTRVDIFNRKTGTIMRGNDGIHVKDLVQALRDHAEYEPILPCPKKRAKKQHSTYRESRTSPNARVSEVVQPQTMIRSSNVEGRHVIVTAGAHKGLLGKVYACIPGNWYMITDVSNPDDYDYVIHAKNLQIIAKHQLPYGISANDEEVDPQEGVARGGAEETRKVAASSNKQTRQTGRISSLPVPSSQTNILSLRNKIKGLGEQQLQLNKALDTQGGGEHGRNDDKRTESMKNLEDVTKALEESKSELQTKIFLDEILRSSEL